MTLKRFIFVFFFVSLIPTLFSQQLFYSTILNGGITGNGGSAGLGSGTIVMPVQIPSNSTIKKAYLIAVRDSLADDITVTLNGIPYTYTNSTIVTNGFKSAFTLPNSSIHALDITTDIDSSLSIYNLIIPPHLNPTYGTYILFYLCIIFENPVLPKISCNIFLNTQDVAIITQYTLNNLTPIDTTKIVSIGVVTNHICDTIQDGSFVSINGNAIGLLGGGDLNSNLWGECVGPWANFAHYNDSLFGLDDDNPDSLMVGTDALADVKNYVNNGDTTLEIVFTYQTPSWVNGKLTNPIRAVMLSYFTPCDTFTTTATTNTDTVCAGESIQLTATGGATYSWFSAFSTFNDSTLANPLATPTQTTTYIVTIKNDSGCVKTEHVKVWVHPAPKPDTITTTPQRCGSIDGSVTVGNIAQGTPPFNYQLTNLTTGNLQSQISNSFNNLLAGIYVINITDSNGCTWQSDTLFVPEINDITVNFSVYTLPWVFPQPNPLGTAPLTVYTQNASVNVNSYEWWVVSDELGVRDTIEQIPASAGMTNPNFNLDSGGTFEICLLAYNNIPTCGDTVCKTVVIAPNSGVDSLVLIVPNVFSPNHDGNNDNFALQVQGASLLESLNVEIFNRWGLLVQGLRFDVESLASVKGTFVIWDGTTNTGKEVPEGTYFYVVSYTKLSGESESLKGTVTLLR